MASILSVLSGNNPNVDDDLEWSARDAASKRRLQEFTRPPAAVVTPPPPPNPLDTPEAANRFSDAAWNAIFGTPLDNFYTPPAVPTNVPDGTKIEPSGSGEFLQDFLKPRPEKGLPPERILSPAEKEVQDKAQIKNFLRSPESVNLFAVARQRDNQFILQNKIIQDYDKMSMYQFAKRYGMDTLNDMATLGVGGDEIESWVSSTTSAGLLDSLRDIGAHGISTAASGFADLGAAGVGGSVGSGTMVGQGLDALSEYFGGPKLTKYTDEASVRLAQSGRDVSDTIVNALQTDDSYKAEAIANYETQADHIDEEIEYQKTLRTNGEMIAELRRFGKNTMHGAARLWENPKHLENLTSQAIGSMATLGPILKGVSLASKGLKATKLGAGALKFAPFSQFETAVGIQSGASTYSDVAVQIAGMEHKDLMATSPEYRTMIMSGYTPEEAKTSLASRGGATAGRSAFVTGALTSALAPEGFERSIFSPGARKTFTQGIKELPAIMGREFIEETPQSAGEQFATNYALQQYVDENQRLSENVGETGIQGGIAGLLSGPMVKSPGLLYKGTKAALTAPLKYADRKLSATAARQAAKNQAAEPVSTENLTPAMSNAAAQAPALAESLKALVPTTEQVKSETTTETAPPLQAETTPELSLRDVLQSQGPQDGQAPISTAEPATKIEAGTQAPVPIESVKEITPEETTETAEKFISKVETAAALQPDDLVVLTPTLIGKFRESVAATPDKVPTRFDAITVMAKVIEDPKAAEEDKVAAAMFITNIISENKALFENKPAFLNDAPQDHPTVKAFDAYEKIVTSMERNPAVAKALKWGQDELTMSDRDLSKTDLASPEGQTLINNLVNVATHVPHKLNENLANQVLTLSQEDKATSALTPEKRKALQAATSMLAGPREYARNNTTETPATAEATVPLPSPATPATPASPTIESGLDIVGRQIETEGGARGYKRSLKDHVVEINQAIKSGNVAEIKTRIKKLALFALSQRNKLEAMQQSIDGKGSTDPASLGRVPYEAFDGKKMRPADGVFEVWFNTKAASSVDAAQRIHQAATLLTNQANHYIDMFPEVGIQKATVPDLRLPGSQAVGGSSTTSQQAVPTPATTSEVTATGQLELPLSPATSQAPAATDTTAATTQTSTPAGGRPQFSVEQIQDETTFPNERLQKGINLIKGLKNPTANNLATLEALEAEVERRKPKAKTKTKKVVSQIDRLVRKAIGKIGKPKERPLNLFRFLASKTINGIQDESGALAAMGLTKKFIPGMGRLIRAKGKTLDEAREAVAEAGYFDEQYGSPEEAMAKSTPDDLLKLISQEAGGQPAYSQRMDADVQFEWLEYEQRQKAREAYDNLLSETDEVAKENGLGPLRDNVLVRAAELVAEKGVETIEALEQALEEDLRAALEQDEMENDIFKNPGFPLFFEAESEGQDTGTGTGSVSVAGQTGNTGGQPGTGSQAKGSGQRVSNTGQDEKLTVVNDFIDTLEIEETPTTDIQTVHPDLITVGEAKKNWFWKAFRLPKVVASRLTLLDRPLAKLHALLGSVKSLNEFLAEAKIIRYSLTPSDLDAQQRLLKLGQDALKHMHASLTTALNSKPFKDDERTLLQRLQAGVEQSLRTRDNRILNLLEIKGDNYRYNPQLIQAAMLGALDWVMNIGDRVIPVDVKAVAETMGIDQAYAYKYLEVFQDGISRDMAVRTLGDNILKFMGVQTNRDEKEDFTKGIREAIAKEMLVALEKVELLQTGIETMPEITKKEFGRVWFNRRPQSIQNLITQLHRTHTLLRDVSLVNAEQEGYSVGEPITDIDESQLRQNLVTTTTQQKEALSVGQATPYFLDQIQLNLMQAMDEEGFVTLMSGFPYSDGDLNKDHNQMGYNKNHWKSIQGRQRGLRATYRNIQKQIALMDNYAKTKGIPITEVPVYYKHHINRLGRPQMDGLSNPQTDKTARHLFLPTKSVLNLTTPGSRSFRQFMKTVAQGIGVKTERKLGDDAINEAIARTMEKDGDLRPLVETFKIWLQGDQKNIQGTTYKLMQDMGPAKLTDHMIHALMAVARYENARDAGEDLTKFVNMNPLEADGKTNGVINALMMSVKQMTADWLRTIAKGGVFFGHLGKTLNQHYLEDSDDIYQADANLMAINMSNLLTRLGNQNDKATYGQMQRMRRLLASFSDDVNFNPDGELEIKRGLAKSPQTKSVYGAGSKSLAVTIANDLIDLLYERMTEEIRTGTLSGDLIYGKGGDATMFSDLRALVSNTPNYNSETKTWELEVESTHLDPNPKEFTLTDRQSDTLVTNVQAFLVGPLQKAINQNVNRHVKEVNEAVQRATQIQSIFSKALYVDTIINAIAEKKANPEQSDYHQGEFSLSESEMTKIRKLIKKFSPFIDTGTQRYMMNGGETTNLFEKTVREVNGQPVVVNLPTSLSRTLDSQIDTPVYIYGATTAGVRATPTLNVGSGDGQMMLNFLVDNPDIARRVLHVFDGLYLPADLIETGSQAINKAVYDTWTKNENPIRAVLDSYVAFMRNSPVDTLFPGTVRAPHQMQALRELSSVVSGKPIERLQNKDMVDSVRANAAMKGLVNTLNELADITDINHQIYTEFDLSVDQMASGETPHVHEGSIKVNITDPALFYDQMAAAMQKRFDQLMAERVKSRTKTAAVERPAIPTGSAPKTAAEINAIVKTWSPLKKFLIDHSVWDEESGAQVVNVRQLRNLPGQSEVMSVIVENLAKENYLLVFGNSNQLDLWESINNERYQPGSNQNRFGKIDPVARIITISNETSETTFHELIHAATIAKVMGYYTKSDKLSAADRDAVGRIEDLMNQWLSLDLTTENEATTEAAALAESAIVENQDKAKEARKAGNPELAAQHDAIALNEFMAWVLSNQNLAKVAEKTTVNLVSALIGKALQALKDLIWGKNKAPEVADTLLSQLQFNTQVLTATPTPTELLKQEALNVMLYQSSAFGQNDRITTIREGIANKIIAWLAEPATNVPAYATQAQRERENQTQIARRNRELIGIRAQAHAMVTEFELQFPDISNMQGSSTFQAIQTILMTDMKINPNVMTRLEELYDHTISKLKLEDFRVNQDPNDQNDITQAQEKFDALHGLKAFHVDQYGRTSFMSSFLALAMTSETFRNVLSNMEKPKAEINTQGGVDALLENTTNSMINRVSMALSGEQSTSENITDALDDLTSKLIENIGNQKNYIDTQANGYINGADRYVADKIQSLSGKVVDASNRVISSSGSRVVRGIAKTTRLAATIVNEQAAQDALLTAIGAVNKIEGWDETRAFLNDLVGRNPTNANVWDLISKVRAIVSQTRQRYRDRLPIAIARKFSRVIKTEEWTALYKGLGRSDLATLFDTHGVEGAVEIATSNRALNRETNALETTIRGYEGARADKVIQKAKQLAHQMMTGQYGGVSGNETNFLKNALAVARLFNEREYQNTLVNSQLESDVDRLTTLYALTYLSAEDKAMIQELSQNELDGLKFVSHYLAGLRKNEMAKVNGRLGIPNYRKGYIPSEKQNEGTLIIANDNQHAYLTKLGYVKVADYEGSSADRTRIARAYYFSPVSGTSPFRQGIMQTVHYTAMGIDPQTGYMTDQLTGGRIDNPQVVDLVKRIIPRQRQTTEHLLPVFDNLTGEVVAYERSSDPLKITGIDRSTHLAKMMAAWKGRQAEEAFAPEVNKTLVDELKKTWDKAVQDGKTNQFVNVMVPNGDPVLEDAVKLIPNYTRDYITQVFGKDRFMVRRDLELQALGDRQASIGDAFTANTRWKKPVQERFEKMALGLFATAPFVKLLGNNQAYTSLVRSEKLLHEFVTNAKNTIVIKSVVVPVANILSNFGQLLTRGVPLRTIIREFPKKVMEINTYIKARNKEIELEAELQAAQGEKNDKEIRKLESRIAALNDSYKRLSIYPLIQGGQFASISQGQVTAEDLALAENKWSNYMDTLLNKLPDNGLRTTAKYGMVAKDTALFRALAASVQYGDFVAKAILYDDLTIRQDMKSDEAIAMVGEAFVNYNVLAGRGRDWYEKSGLLWFYNFKLRSVKEAAYLLRHHPLRSLLSMTLPGLSDLDSPLDSNVISLGVDGKLDWSIGPGMGFNAWTMNPVVNLVN